MNRRALVRRPSPRLAEGLITHISRTLLGAERTHEFLNLVEPVGERLLARIDATAGPEWMPAARRRRR